MAFAPTDSQIPQLINSGATEQAREWIAGLIKSPPGLQMYCTYLASRGVLRPTTEE